MPLYPQVDLRFFTSTCGSLLSTDQNRRTGEKGQKGLMVIGVKHQGGHGFICGIAS